MPDAFEVEGGDAVYPPALKAELLKSVGDFYIDCERMPSAEQLRGNETEVIDAWLKKIDTIREQQTRSLITCSPTIRPSSPGWRNPAKTVLVIGSIPSRPTMSVTTRRSTTVRPDAFPDQYIGFDKVLGAILKHADDNTYVFIVSDHGIKPLREFEETDPHAHMDHEKTTPVIAKHDFADGDDVPGSFFAMGPGIKHDLRLMGFEASVYDIAPTILHIYGIEQPKQMHGHVLSAIFESPQNKVAQK